MSTRKCFFVFLAVVNILSMAACGPGTQASPTTNVINEPPEATAEPSTPTTEPQPTAPAPTNTVEATSASGCDNPYLPVVVGATWNYKLTGPIPDTFTHTILSADEDSFVEQDAFGSGVTRQAEWRCEEGGLIAMNPPSGSSGTVSAEGVSVDLQTKDVSGVTLPATIQAGDTWSQALTLEGTQTVNGVAYPASNQLTSDCTAMGIESLTVEAGTFDTMRVECQTTMALSLQLGETPMQTTLNLTGTTWYAENVGIVKTSTAGSGLDSTTELISYTIP